MFRVATFHDIVSLSLLPLIGFPLYVGLAYNDLTYLFIFTGALAVGFTTIILKIVTTYITDDPLFYRPPDAMYCTLFNGRCNPRESAFPSGHVAVATFLTCALSQRTSILEEFTKNFAVMAYITLMAYSRYSKRCHNIAQIIGGACYGYIVFKFLYQQ